MLKFKVQFNNYNIIQQKEWLHNSLVPYEAVSEEVYGMDINENQIGLVLLIYMSRTVAFGVLFQSLK